MKSNDPTQFCKATEPTNIFNVYFGYMDVRAAIDQLSVNTSAGPDGMPVVLIKQARDNLIEPFTMLGTKSLETRDIPELFKMAFITPVLKPGAPECDASSYRPVSLTSHLIKHLKVLFKRFSKTILKSPLLSMISNMG